MTDTQKLLNFICEMHYAINTNAVKGREFDLPSYFNNMLKLYEIDALYIRHGQEKANVAAKAYNEKMETLKVVK